MVITCPNIDSLTTKPEVGGVWLAALARERHPVTGATFSGIYDDGAPLHRPVDAASGRVNPAGVVRH